MGQQLRSALRAVVIVSVVSEPYEERGCLLTISSQLTTSHAGVLLEQRQSAVAGWTYYGCQTEATNARALSSKSTAYDTMTLESCASNCAGYTYFGTEYGRECEQVP
jgi:hypothetical protein